jgi:hypothetical protein
LPACTTRLISLRCAKTYVPALAAAAAAQQPQKALKDCTAKAWR